MNVRLIHVIDTHSKPNKLKCQWYRLSGNCKIRYLISKEKSKWCAQRWARNTKWFRLCQNKNVWFNSTTLSICYMEHFGLQ